MYQRILKFLKRKKIQFIQKRRSINFGKKVSKSKKNNEKMRKHSSLVSLSP